MKFYLTFQSIIRKILKQSMIVKVRSINFCACERCTHGHAKEQGLPEGPSDHMIVDDGNGLEYQRLSLASSHTVIHNLSLFEVFCQG